MTDREQIRKERDTIGKRDNDSALAMSPETEQRVLREFHSPLPSSEEQRTDSALLRNASWLGR